MRRALVVLASAGLILAVAGTGALAAPASHLREATAAPASHPREATAARGSLPKVATGAAFGAEPTYAVRPHTIWFTGDGTGILGRLLKGTPAVGKQPGFLHWKSWTRKRAYGVGTEWFKSGGGVGRFHRTPVTVTLTDPRRGHFVKMTLHDKLGVDTRCNPPRITYWTIPSGPLGSTSCRGT